MVKAIYTGSEFLETAIEGVDAGIVLESTSFYAEQGGQVFSCGHFIEPSFLLKPDRSVHIFNKNNL